MRQGGNRCCSFLFPNSTSHSFTISRKTPARITLIASCRKKIQETYCRNPTRLLSSSEMINGLGICCCDSCRVKSPQKPTHPHIHPSTRSQTAKQPPTHTSTLTHEPGWSPRNKSPRQGFACPEDSKTNTKQGVPVPGGKSLKKVGMNAELKRRRRKEEGSDDEEFLV